ncbi:alpha/beta hydrolase [Pseudofrankia sp. BMG5.37]|uniref:alpha/beta hydrolase n=1 Tax=Pseudofrankia sp. BMG5.37 TaxID=3050035 RepID=UPI002895730D|nr:alpha/beta hydrolase [Pseudofrankia sp. BMG5.37]MDT3445717.1 alpha/beta hydrolase [Pseudofrankia sp. BMG5.37]
MTDPTHIPVVFVHGLWMHSSSWDSWIDLVDELGYSGVAPGWPGDAATTEASRENPGPLANRGIAEITDHYAAAIRELPQVPIVIGHSFGGLIAQRLLGMNLARGGVVISPAQFRGNRKLPLAQLQSGFPVLGNPANKKKTVLLTQAQFHKGFANAVSREESDDLWNRYAIPGPGLPLFQAATANFSSKTEATVDVASERGPLLIIAGGKDRTVPAVTSKAAYGQYAKNPSVTEYHLFEDRAHSMAIDQGWREVADVAMDFLTRHGLAAAPQQVG